ncbi:MAG: trans-acting enoyl reductase family protein [Salinirussus sp.]
MPENGHHYDIVLWGATGFTGQLVAEHLAERLAVDLEWAIAGRDPEKLTTVRENLEEIDPQLATVDILIGDAFDRESLNTIAEQTSVVCSTVGPYAEYGSELVAACVDQQADYCDLSGEIHWIQRMIDEHHDRARDKGVRIVHGCGFDSIPSDLGTLFIQNHAQDEFGTPCSRVRAYITSPSFELSKMAKATSGGTMASMKNLYATRAKDRQIRQTIDNPYSLAPNGERTGPDTGVQLRPAYDSLTDQWTAPFVMAGINEKIVRRTNAVLGYPWGRDFEYSEVTPTGGGFGGASLALAKSVGLGAFIGAMSVRPIRNLVDTYVLPDPGEGPSQDTIEAFWFSVRLVGTGTIPDSGASFRIEGSVAGDRDPGYGSAARMLGESAICLATGDIESPFDGGVLTAASGIGLPLIDRLESSGMTFTIESHADCHDH